MVKIEKQKAENAIFRLVQGMLLGGSGILPGVSGGVLCVVFGIYKPLMEVLSSPVKKIKEYWKMLLPIGIGAVFGFVLTVNVLGSIMDGYKALAECVFLGLIIGTMPSLYRTAGREKRTKASYAALVLSFVTVFSCLFILEHLLSFSVTPTFLWFAAAGVIFGISVVLPGLSAYTVLEFFGIFEPILDGVRTFDFSVLVPVGIGGAVALILLSKLINILYETHFSVMSHIIIGIVVATTLPLVPTHFADFGDFVLQIALMLCGFAVAMLFSHLEDKFKM
ncbi:MAG: DUF368 domain-containing protein [Clostridia bacterium]|nr:DUF368 domain-containing protein [Clostridia bacterium]